RRTSTTPPDTGPRAPVTSTSIGTPSSGSVTSTGRASERWTSVRRTTGWDHSALPRSALPAKRTRSSPAPGPASAAVFPSNRALPAPAGHRAGDVGAALVRQLQREVRPLRGSSQGPSVRPPGLAAIDAQGGRHRDRLAVEIDGLERRLEAEDGPEEVLLRGLD